MEALQDTKKVQEEYGRLEEIYNGCIEALETNCRDDLIRN